MNKILYIHHIDVLENVANGIQVLQMCYALSKSGFQLTLLCPSNLSDKDLLNRIKEKIGKAPNFQIYTFSNKNKLLLGKSFQAAFRINKILRKIKGEYDLCFNRHYLLNFFALNNHYKTIFEIHANKFTSFSIINKLVMLMVKKKSLAPQQIFLIAISNKLREYLIDRGINSDKIITLHDGFNSEYFENALDKQSARNMLNLSLDIKTVVYVGSLYKDRDIESILKLASDFNSTLFLIIGGPNFQKEYYEKLAKKMNITNLTFFGNIEHSKIKYYLFASDVLLMIWSWRVPTINYCSPLKVFEYMAAGRNIVGQSFPTIKEVLTDGKNSFLASPDSYDELNLKLKEALSLEYPNPIANCAREDAFKYYSWRKRAEKIFLEVNNNY